MRERLRGADGFTLPEVLVSMVMMVLVLFALYAMFDVAVRVSVAGRDEAEAAQNARLGLARMEREIRAAYPQDRAGGDAVLLRDFGKTRIVFGNDIDGDRRITDPATGVPEPGEGISYALNSRGVPTRNGVRLVGPARDVDGDGKAMTFEYLEADGDAAAGEAGVALVRIRLEISVPGAAGGETVDRILQTSVALRNR